MCNPGLQLQKCRPYPVNEMQLFKEREKWVLEMLLIQPWDTALTLKRQRLEWSTNEEVKPRKIISLSEYVELTGQKKKS